MVPNKKTADKNFKNIQINQDKNDENKLKNFEKRCLNICFNRVLNNYKSYSIEKFFKGILNCEGIKF